MNKLEASILNNYLINLSNKEYISDFLKKRKILNDKNNIISFSFVILSLQKIADDYSSEILEDITDGQDDNNIDIFNIQENGKEYVVNLAQIKYKSEQRINTTISSSEIRLFLQSIEAIFINKELENLNINNKLKEKCYEYYSLPTDNIKLNLFLITNGGDITENDYNILKTFEKKHNFVKINFINHFEFFLDDEKKLNEKYSIELSQRPFIMVDNIIKSFVINIEAEEICRLYEHYQNTILNKNIRKLVRSKLNKEITKSILYEPEMFWYKNNGISIIAKYVDIKDISGKTVISLKEPYIVNGGQTTKLLFNLFKKNNNKNILENSILLVRIYKTENDEQISDIVLGTNQQNKITLYDLKSSNKTLKKLKMFFEQEGISLLIQRNSEEKVFKRNISSDKLLQIYCSMYRKIPHISKSSKESIIKEYYDNVYSNYHIHNDLLLSFLIYETIINEYNSLKSNVNHIPHSLYAVLYTMFLLSSNIVSNFRNNKIFEKNNILKNFNKSINIITEIVSDLKKIDSNFKIHNYFKSSKSTHDILEYIKNNKY